MGNVKKYRNGVWVGREESGVNAELNKWMGRWPKREGFLRNGCREEIWLLMTDTRNREWLCKGQSCKKNDGLSAGRANGV